VSKSGSSESIPFSPSVTGDNLRFGWLRYRFRQRNQAPSYSFNDRHLGVGIASLPEFAAPWLNEDLR